ncbi:glycosyl transferase, group 2 family protein [Coleofasciculus chthonoplastes PCC 7420]|uniref:Glycosyl transferase, group 2 family protein n=1 Tax=Coleofasciculus chthonoplastes PCC 7420 TaxID=118168 RepID=B4VH89_9CYAN|nr:glycosyltransferase family 2 protein [Coleofasciculus chthonoplastes]EDX78742.1 glycosyl transferase, group 2 family protein [Coleofasciculus chthonoplastes PCC 7420]
MQSIIDLEQLPPSFAESEWPWSTQTISVPNQIPNGHEYPRISIITPSYNQGQFIEETIRSVLLQNYPNLEYIIIDGGSTDNSVEIIRKYEPWLNYWVSEPDQGQSDAIQKGFNLCTGIIWNWLNSDDILEPNALYNIAIAYQTNSEATIYSGQLTVFGQGESMLAPRCFQTFNDLVCVWEKWAVPQPAIFMNRKSCIEVNGLNTSLHYGMDYDLYLRLALLPEFNVHNIEELIAKIRRHPNSKTVSKQIYFRREILKVFDSFVNRNYCSLPLKWKRSRFLFEYISALKFNQDTNSLSSFFMITMPYWKEVWKYRYFWGALYQRIKSKMLLNL